MKKIAKEFIESAVPMENDSFTDMWILDSDKIYDGFWGKNGYNNIIILGMNRDKGETKLEMIADGVNTECDVFQLEPEERCMIEFDINRKNGIFHLFTHGKFVITRPVISSCSVKVTK